MKKICLVLIALVSFNHAWSTALKVCNDTDYSWRVSVDGKSWQYIDPQGSCQCYQSARCPQNPGDIHNVGWVDIANKVKDKWYRVQFEYLRIDKKWYQAFDIKMQGDYFTNIAQIIEIPESRKQELHMWWEPPRQKRGDPKCRDKPLLEGCRTNTCLVRHTYDPLYRNKY